MAFTFTWKKLAATSAAVALGGSTVALVLNQDAAARLPPSRLLRYPPRYVVLDLSFSL